MARNIVSRACGNRRRRPSTACRQWRPWRMAGEHGVSSLNKHPHSDAAYSVHRGHECRRVATGAAGDLVGCQLGLQTSAVDYTELPAHP
jgi:hypothetical protein